MIYFGLGKGEFMKKIISLILVLVLIAPIKVKAATNPYKKTSSYGINCTWYAWRQAHDKAGVTLPGWGNANTWLNYAKKAGYETGTTPRAKSIVVWKWSNYGHVGYVERVSNGKIYVWDSEGPCTDNEDPDYKECLANSPSESGDKECYKKYGKSIACEYDATYWSVPGDLIGYIYLDKAPTKPNNNTSNSGTQTNSNTPLKKSNNANLKSLTISDIDFTFKKDTLKYTFEVESNTEKVEIKAVVEDKKAKVDGVKEYPLVVGLNTIKIEVTAEDKTKKTYTLEIKRKNNNAYLRNLVLSNGNINFNKEKFNYELELDDNIKSIKVDGTSESANANIEGLGEYNLFEDNTKINIKVVAEDKSENIYTLNIKKKTKKEEVTEIKKESKNTKKIYLICGIVSLIVIIIFAVLLIKKRKE